MKKTLLALAVMTAAGAVSATTIVENDKATVTTSGTAKVAFISGTVAAGDERRAKINLGDAGIVFGVDHQIGDDLTAFGAFGITIEEGNIGSKDVNAGVKGSWGTLTFGQAGQAWNAGNSKHQELGLDPADDDFISGDDVVKYAYSADMWNIAVSHNFTQAAGEAMFEGTTAATVGVSLSNFNFGADFAVNGDDTAYAVKADGSVDLFSIGASYLTTDTAALGGEASLIDYWIGFDASDSTTVYLGGQSLVDYENEPSTIYVNATYDVMDSVQVFGEIGTQSDPLTGTADFESSLAFAAGMSVSF
jgi:hypothetical protein